RQPRQALLPAGAGRQEGARPRDPAGLTVARSRATRLTAARSRVAALTGVAVPVLTGCGDSGARGARAALPAHLRPLPDDGGYRVSDVHCTHGGRVYFQPVRTTRYFCTARVAESGDCDLFRVDARRDGSALVTPVRRAAGCVLPGG